MSKAVRSDEKNLFSDFEALSRKGRKEALDFMKFLRLKEETEATREILDDRVILESLQKGEGDFRKKRFRKWTQVREDV
jgi:hypothetical protein